ncbi:MAG: hypothetical protein K8R40_08610 [Anaerolineaceae bacterium]|nr:hypothetical protein [Anaerolineaceae bacterium]
MADQEKVKKQKKAQFLPWSAINAFMLQDFQHEVLHAVLGSYDRLTSAQRSGLNKMIKRGVTVNGFRNAVAAPLAIKVNSSVSLFESNAAFAGLILASWSSLFPELRKQVYELLLSREWELLPEETDRTKLPGFLAQWPKQDEFDVLVAAFRDTYGTETYSDNQISLMSVWLSGRLPYELVDLAKDSETIIEKE